MRIHAQAKDALWFGAGSGRHPIHRFDDPAGRFRACYLGTTLEVSFAETSLRNPPVRILALDDLAGRSIATVEVRRDLRLVPIHGSSPTGLEVTAELASGSDYVGSQLWSRALWEHSDEPDGILYRSRRDDSALCIAVYDRAEDGLAIVRDHSGFRRRRTVLGAQRRQVRTSEERGVGKGAQSKAKAGALARVLTLPQRKPAYADQKLRRVRFNNWTDQHRPRHARLT